MNHLESSASAVVYRSRYMNTWQQLDEPYFDLDYLPLPFLANSAS